MMEEEVDHKQTRRDAGIPRFRFGIGLKIAFLLCVCVVCASAFTGMWIFNDASEMVFRQKADSLKLGVERIARYWDGRLDKFRTETLFLAGTPPVGGMVRARRAGGVDPWQNTPEETWRQRFEIISLVIIRREPECLGIQFIALEDNGREMVSVKAVEGDAAVVPPDRLESVGDLPPIRKALELDPGEVFYSDIELQKQEGRLVEPPLPVLRVATPIFDETGAPFGAVVSSWDLRKVFASLRDMTNPVDKLYLTNEAGDFLIHPDPRREFGFEHGVRHRFREEFDEAVSNFTDVTVPRTFWRRPDFIDGSLSHMYAVQNSRFASADPERFVTFIYRGDQEIMLQLWKEMRYSTMVAIMGMASLALMLGLGLSTKITRPLRRIADALGAYGRGVLTEFPKVRNRDESGILAHSFARMVEEVEARSEELAASERRLASILNNAGDAIVSVDGDGRIVQFNSAAENIFGYQAREIIGQPLEWLLPEGLPEIQHPVADGESAPSGRKGGWHPAPALDSYRRDGSRFKIEASISKVEAHGAVISTLIVRDVTARRKAEQKLKRARKTAENANRAKSAFLANMSHEIRTPMNAILGFCQLLHRDTSLTPDQRKNVEVIVRSGEHLLALINDILEMSKIEAGRVAMSSVTFDLPELIDDLENMFRVRSDEKGLGLQFEAVGSVPRFVVADQGKIRQVLINLLGNAIKFTPEGGVVFRYGMEAEETGGQRLIVEVEDSGIGIEAADIERLFKPFAQTRSGIEAEGGTGLGLAISKEFAALMGGDLTVTSQPGKGSLFRFETPVDIATGDRVKSAKPPPKVVVGLIPGTPLKRILIVDDKKSNRELLHKLLEPVGFSLREAADGEQAIRIFEEWAPDLILMDMAMPVMDGYEATRRIKDTDRGRATKIVAVTASAFEGDRKRIISAGVEGYIRKPFRQEEIFNVLRKLLNVDYDYAEPPEPETGREAEAEAETDLESKAASLPDALRQGLREATRNADLERILALLDEVESLDEDLAARLRDLANAFEYEHLTELLENQKGQS